MSASTTETFTISSSDLVRISGATYRQIDFWTRRGYLVPLVAAHGSGTSRRWQLRDIGRASVMAALSKLSAQGGAPAELLKLVGTTDPPWVMYVDGVRISIKRDLGAFPRFSDE